MVAIRYKLYFCISNRQTTIFVPPEEWGFMKQSCEMCGLKKEFWEEEEELYCTPWCRMLSKHRHGTWESRFKWGQEETDFRSQIWNMEYQEIENWIIAFQNRGRDVGLDICYGIHKIIPPTRFVSAYWSDSEVRDQDTESEDSDDEPSEVASDDDCDSDFEDDDDQTGPDQGGTLGGYQ